MIIGNRIRLRGIERSDLPRFVLWLNDPDVYRNLLISVPLSLAQEEIWFERTIAHAPKEQPLVVEVKTGEDWLPIGNVGLQQYDDFNHSAEFGIVLGEKSYWNQGYGREAAALMVKHGFYNLNLNRIFLHVYETNPAAIRSYEAAGFVQEGRLRQERYLEGHYVDVLVMSVLHSEWKEPDFLKSKGS